MMKGDEEDLVMAIPGLRVDAERDSGRPKLTWDDRGRY